MPQAYRAENGPQTTQCPNGEVAMTIVEIAIAIALLGIIAAAAIAALSILNNNAASTRVMGSAREIVQRNIEAAMGSPFTSTNIPPILAMPSNDLVWDEKDGTNFSRDQTIIYSSRDANQQPPVLGTLRRTVTAESNPSGADIRRVTFRLVYPAEIPVPLQTLFGHRYSYEVTTIRAMDK